MNHYFCRKHPEFHRVIVAEVRDLNVEGECRIVQFFNSKGWWGRVGELFRAQRHEIKPPRQVVQFVFEEI